MRNLCNIFTVVSSGRTRPKTKFTAALFGSLIASHALAANVLTCPDASFVGKPVWPQSGACPNQVNIPAGPNLIVATTDAKYTAQAWKKSADILPTDAVFTDTTVSGNKWQASTAFVWTAAPVLTTGAIDLKWTPPTQNIDDSPLTDLSGFQLYSGAQGAVLSKAGVPLPATSTSYRVTGLAPGNYSFAITAVTSGGTESDRSNVVTKPAVMPKTTAKAPVLAP